MKVCAPADEARALMIQVRAMHRMTLRIETSFDCRLCFFFLLKDLCKEIRDQEMRWREFIRYR